MDGLPPIADDLAAGGAGDALFWPLLQDGHGDDTHGLDD